MMPDTDDDTSTEEVRQAFVHEYNGILDTYEDDGSGAMFDRWLAAHDAVRDQETRAAQREVDAQIAEAATTWSIMGHPDFDQQRAFDVSVADDRARIAAAIRADGTKR
jgi:hypothetical protein